MIYSVLGRFAIFSVFDIFGCILMYSDTEDEPYELLVSEIILALLVGGAYLIELGGGI